MAEDRLVPMANQIATFFRAYPEAEAVAGIGEHIRAFWTPAMRQALRARIAASSEGVDRLVVLATVKPATSGAESPIMKETEGPAELGQAVSDAG